MRSIIFRLLSWPRISYAITIYRPFLFSLFKNQVSLSKHLFTDSDIKPSKDASRIKVKIIDFFLNYIVDPKGIEPSTLSLQGRNASHWNMRAQIVECIRFERRLVIPNDSCYHQHPTLELRSQRDSNSRLQRDKMEG